MPASWFGSSPISGHPEEPQSSVERQTRERHRKNMRPGYNIASDTTTTEGTRIPRPGTLLRVQRKVCNSGALKVGSFQ